MKVLGAAHSLETITFCRGLYHKSELDFIPPRSFFQRPTISRSLLMGKKPPGALPFASPNMEMMMSEPRQWTVWGADRLVFFLICSPQITLCSFGLRGSVAQSMKCRFDVRTPGTIRYLRSIEPSP